MQQTSGSVFKTNIVHKASKEVETKLSELLDRPRIPKKRKKGINQSVKDAKNGINQSVANVKNGLN